MTIPARKPEWLRKPHTPVADTAPVRRAIHDGALNTVCRSARCPNLSECYAAGVATFLILGDTCARGCGFCAVTRGSDDGEWDRDEPERVAQAARAMGLSHVVITSVTRDDLPDGGADAFVQTIGAARAALPGATIEVLTPDFLGQEESILAVAAAAPGVYNHNVETVPALYSTVRPKAEYRRSLRLLEMVKARHPAITTKSGVMLGLGETHEQVIEVMRDLRAAACDILTIGQYLRPSKSNLPVVEYIPPERFEQYTQLGEGLGFRKVFAGPFVRSSYHAGELLRA
ncbi:MAG: lipoyl synthase [Nitrospinae bacterium]|nr:lipoyl synthase [Nitrospinota bacterium]